MKKARSTCVNKWDCEAGRQAPVRCQSFLSQAVICGICTNDQDAGVKIVFIMFANYTKLEGAAVCSGLERLCSGRLFDHPPPEVCQKQAPGTGQPQLGIQTGTRPESCPAERNPRAVVDSKFDSEAYSGSRGGLGAPGLTLPAEQRKGSSRSAALRVLRAALGKAA